MQSFKSDILLEQEEQNRKQALFEKIADLEEKAFYHKNACKDPAAVVLHNIAREILEEYAKITGCHN